MARTDGELVKACRNADWDLGRLQAPPGYHGLALAIIDAIWSIGVRCGTVENVLATYRSWVKGPERSGNPETRTARELVDDIASVGKGKDFAEQVVSSLPKRWTSRLTPLGLEMRYAALMVSCRGSMRA